MNTKTKPPIEAKKYVKGFKYPIYPNKEQKELLAKTFGCVRFVWNKAFYAVFDSTSNVIGEITPYKNEVISELKHLRSNGKTGWIKRIYPFYQVVELSNKELIISSTHPVRLNYLIVEY